MQLSFQSKYLSITEFAPVDLPDLVVLTGVNGAGKSHLMDAINRGHVAVHGIDNAHIVLFNYETFRLDNETAFNTQQIEGEREAMWQHYKSRIAKHAASWRTTLDDTYPGLKAQCMTDGTHLWGVKSASLQRYKHAVKAYFRHPQRRQNQQEQAVYSLAKSIPCSLDDLEKDDFFRFYKPLALKNDFLPVQLGKVFWDYYAKSARNKFNAFQNAAYGTAFDVLSEEQFVAIHGRKPWDLVNEILRSFDTLKYNVTSPEGEDFFGSFQLRLRHTENPELEIPFMDLSSGERVLMALVACVYKSSTDRHFPDLILLDEVDASLHPSMVKNMLAVIDRVFLKNGARVILVTHSPTTLALAPEESVHIMNRTGFNRIEHKSRQDALSILTQGFATLEEGLKIFDQVARFKLTIITEGYNAPLIQKALQLYGIGDAEVLSGCEDISGSSQLKTLFKFFARARHDRNVIFVWDCDATPRVVAENNTYPYVIPHNSENAVAKKGIENAFPSALFKDFTKTITLSTGVARAEFDDTRKRDFMTFVLERSNRSDFDKFAGFIAEVRRIQNVA